MTCLLLNLEILVRDASLWCWPLTTVEWCLWSVTQWCHCYQLHHHYHHHHYILHCVVSIVPSFLAAWYFNWDVSLTLFILYLPQTHSHRLSSSRPSSDEWNSLNKITMEKSILARHSTTNTILEVFYLTCWNNWTLSLYYPFLF